MILDTNALSAFFDGDPELLHLLQTAPELHIPAIVIGEYQFGLNGSNLQKERELKLREFIKTCTVLTVLESTALAYGSIKHDLKTAGTPIPENDIWISALALEYGLPVISRDTHFRNVAQLSCYDW